MKENNSAAIAFRVLTVVRLPRPIAFLIKTQFMHYIREMASPPAAWHDMASGHSGMLLVDSGHGHAGSNLKLAKTRRYSLGIRHAEKIPGLRGI